MLQWRLRSVRRGMIQLAWRFLRFQGDSALAKWYQARTETAQGHAQDDDRRARAKVADCFVALRDDGHGTGWGALRPAA